MFTSILEATLDLASLRSFILPPTAALDGAICKNATLIEVASIGGVFSFNHLLSSLA